MRQINSEITGALERVQERAKSTGVAPGTTASETLPAVLADARIWLEKHTPAEVDRALKTSLQSSLGVVVNPKTRLMFPPAGGYYEVSDGCDLGGEEQNFGAAYEKIMLASTPPTREQAENLVVMLQAATTGGKRSEFGAEVALELYVAALSRYPVDVAKAACMDLATSVKWFPVLAELIEKCDRLSAKRRSMVGALRTWAR